jgi:hypothetical protein
MNGAVIAGLFRGTFFYSDFFVAFLFDCCSLPEFQQRIDGGDVIFSR